MRFIPLFQNNRSIGKYDVPERIAAGSNRTFRLQGATRVGGNGVVFEATEYVDDQATGLHCAVKLLKQLTPSRIDRFNNEVRVLQELSSPFVSAYFASGNVTVHGQQYSATAEEEVPWVAIQLGGSNMRQHVENHGALPLPVLKGMVPGLCSAIEHLHEKGFIHRDIKPENFVWRDAASKQPLMIDFGIAKRQGEDVSGRPMDAFTQVSEFVGPVFFSSPELIEYSRDKQHPVDYRSDIFQLGKLLWYLGTGKISAGIPSRRECPAGGKFREVVLNMIDDDPEGRPQSLADVRAMMNGV